MCLFRFVCSLPTFRDVALLLICAHIMYWMRTSRSIQWKTYYNKSLWRAYELRLKRHNSRSNIRHARIHNQTASTDSSNTVFPACWTSSETLSLTQLNRLQATAGRSPFVEMCQKKKKLCMLYCKLNIFVLLLWFNNSSSSPALAKQQRHSLDAGCKRFIKSALLWCWKWDLLIPRWELKVAVKAWSIYSIINVHNKWSRGVGGN